MSASNMALTPERRSCRAVRPCDGAASVERIDSRPPRDQEVDVTPMATRTLGVMTVTTKQVTMPAKIRK